MNEHLELLGKARSSWLYPIYVPSAYRAGSAPLLDILAGAPRRVQELVTIVTLPKQVVGYSLHYPWARVITESKPGIGPARMRCLLDADEQMHDRIVVLDDDIRNLTLLNLLEYKPNGEPRTQRYSHTFNGYSKPSSNVRGLAVMCRMADEVFKARPDVAYGAPRNGLFSNTEDPQLGVSINSRGFPACVMFIDVERFGMREMPTPFQHHGEDLAMFLDVLENGQTSFMLRCASYDQHETIETTIPLDPLDEVGRPHLQYTSKYYPDVHPFLRVSMKNKLGGVMRIGMNWKRWYKATGTTADSISLPELIKEIR
ncbi:glycosyltransferase [Microbacterium phage Juicer]|nr:glycosyltransferase [Microbacterium phage Juicer]